MFVIEIIVMKYHCVSDVPFLTVAAVDADDGPDGNVVYSISNSDGPFGIIGTTGDVFISANLDRETIAMHWIEVSVTDLSATLPKTGTTTIDITVIDANDNAPICPVVFGLNVLPPYVISAPLDSPTCKDNDEGTNAQLTYTIQSGNTNGDFTVGSSDGVIYLAQLPTSSSYSIDILVQDMGAVKLSTTMRVAITVLDQPSFSNLPQVMMFLENIGAGAIVYTVASNIPLGRAIYQITAGDGGIYSIAVDTGIITLLDALDRESVTSYDMTISVGDILSSLSTSSTLHIDVGDDNDNTPKFDSSSYIIAIAEDIAVISEVMVVTATDADAGVNSGLSYAIQSGGSGSFSIDGTGSVTVTSALDREITSEYLLEIICTDGGTPVLTGTTFMHIAVDDVNEFTPEFVVVGANYQTNILENTFLGSIIFQITAQDLDAEPSEFAYVITSGNDGTFSIHSVSGFITLDVLLDRETVDYYNLSLEARTTSAGTASSILEIMIDDVNDNNPKFSAANYNFDILASTPVNTFITSLPTTDLDIGANAVMSVAITSGNADNKFILSFFDLTTNGGFDFNIKNEYTLEVTVTDTGTPSMSSVAIINVHITPSVILPDFTGSPVSTNIPEDTNVGTVVFDCDATGSGSTEGSTGRLRYYIVSGNAEGKFSIDLLTGEIQTSSSLDREVVTDYSLVIEARDVYYPTDLDTHTLAIIADDINDNTPTFTFSIYSVSIDEGLAVSTSIESVLATDADSALFGPIEYAIVAGPGSSDFSINTADGEITVANTIDYNIRTSYFLTISASDSGLPPRSSLAGVEIIVNDINDNIPIFSPTTISVTISESLSAHAVVANMIASDDDSGFNGQIFYSFQSGNTGNDFAINMNSGVVTVLSSLDIDATSSYVIIIIATDLSIPVNTGTATLSITILDYNDNTPVITNLPASVNIDEEDPIDTFVFQVMATDDDQGGNADVTFTFVFGNDDSLFSLEPLTGIIKTMNMLTNFDGVFELTVVAMDAGSPAISATSTLTVTIDGTIAVAESHYSFSILEGLPVETVIGSVAADPAIHGATPTVSYSITQGDPNNHLKASSDGDLLTDVVFDREATDEYNIIVHIQDLTSPELSHFDTVHVEVTDTNDNAPIPEMTSYDISVVENTPSGRVLLTLIAADSDVDLNAVFTYSLSTTDMIVQSIFDVSSSGVLSLKAPPDFEAVSSFDFNVLVQDGGSPSLSSTISIHVNITDVDEITNGGNNVPQKPSVFFSSECYSLAVVGDKVLTLDRQSFNLHGPEVTTVKYVTQQTDGDFNIDEDTGDVTVAPNSGITPGDSYTIWVFATASFTSGSDETIMGLIRIDVFSEAILLTHAISEQELMSKQ